MRNTQTTHISHPKYFLGLRKWLLVPSKGLQLVTLCVLSVIISIPAHADPLPSWKNGSAKQRIIEFVRLATEEDSKTFIPPAERIATFDNDGTLWAEQPMYFQLFYAFDTVKKLAPKHPKWQTQEPFASVLKNDYKKALSGGKQDLLKIIAVSHAGMSSEEFSDEVNQWFNTARHPKTGKPFNQMVYQPMLDLLQYLRENGFKTYIVSGGGIDFLRVFAEETYGIPPEQVVGSSIKAKYQVINGKPEIVKLPELNFIDDKEGKPVGIYQHIGR